MLRLRLLRSFVLLIVVTAPFVVAREPSGSESPAVSTIAFGSCAKESQRQPIWDAVLASDPDLFLFLGDNIYGDTDDMAVLRAKYARLGGVEGYQKLVEQCPVLATWDDHDYGRNDAGVEYEFKVGSQKALLDFFESPADSPRRTRKGVYGRWFFGAEGSGRRVQVILLDSRYHRSPIPKAEKKSRPYFGPYLENTDEGATLLGEAQWEWLADRLREPADLRIVGTSIQAIPNGHRWEKWGNFPAERDRLFQLIRDTEANGVVFLSGDRHHSAISKVPAKGAPESVGYPLFEITSSGLTQAGGGNSAEPNPYGVGEIFKKQNFGLIRIDWESGEVVFEVNDRDGESQLKATTRVEDLVEE